MPEPSPLISAASLSNKLGREDLCIIDCRFDLFDPEAGRSAWQNAHVPGAVYAHLDYDLAGPISETSGRHPLPATARITDLVGAWGIGNGTEVVVYDSGNGAIAARAWWMMHWLGHDRVRLLDGGMHAWTGRGLETERGSVVRRRAKRFDARPRDGMIITTAEVSAGIGSGDPVLLLDARDPKRFCGETEPLDTVAGHIPGAVNLPFSGSLTADERFREPGELARRFAEVLPPEPGSRWGVMCGSGVTACHLALAAVRAGLEMPRVYVGSWSEWIRDPARPVETGR